MGIAPDPQYFGLPTQITDTDGGCGDGGVGDGVGVRPMAVLMSTPAATLAGRVEPALER
jgi:hypothetical protein